MSFPTHRPRRLRRNSAIRRLVAETSVAVDDLVAPLFVREGTGDAVPITSMPGVFQHSRDSLRAEVTRLAELGVPGVILFGVPERTDAEGSGAWDPNGIAQLAIADVRSEVGDELVVMADLCLDEYTSHGHCGVIAGDGEIDNDATLALYRRVAEAQAAAGADICAPSGMMDGQVAAIRDALDGAGAQHVGILAYSAKYASALYGPFRDAVDVEIDPGDTGAAGDRCGYQQDWRNAREAVVELRTDVAEGADMVMVKPAMAYLDIVARARSTVEVPVAAYHVSGEYSMVMAAAERGWLDPDAVALEHVGAIRRAGADFVLTYFAGRLAETLSRRP